MQLSFALATAALLISAGLSAQNEDQTQIRAGKRRSGREKVIIFRDNKRPCKFTFTGPFYFFRLPEREYYLVILA
jgi:hypothetical protein